MKARRGGAKGFTTVGATSCRPSSGKEAVDKRRVVIANKLILFLLGRVDQKLMEFEHTCDSINAMLCVSYFPLGSGMEPPNTISL